MENKKENVISYSKLTIDETKALAEQGDAKAQFKLAGCYEKGEGIEKDFAKALVTTVLPCSTGSTV